MKFNKFLLVDFLYYAFRLVTRGTTISVLREVLWSKYVAAHVDEDPRFGADGSVDVPDLLHTYIMNLFNGRDTFQDMLCFEYALWQLIPYMDDLFLGPRFLRLLEFSALNEGRQRTVEQLHRLVMAQAFTIVSPLDGGPLFP